MTERIEPIRERRAPVAVEPVRLTPAEREERRQERERRRRARAGAPEPPPGEATGLDLRA